MKIERMDTVTATNMLFENSSSYPQQMEFSQATLLKSEHLETQSSSTDEMMMDLFNGNDIDLLEDILSMEELFPSAQQNAASLQQLLPPPPTQLASSPPNATNMFPTQWTEIEPTLLSPESVANAPSPPQQPASPPTQPVQQIVLQAQPAPKSTTATLQPIAPAPIPASTQVHIQPQQKSLFVNVQQHQTNTTTATTQIINPFANVFINQHGTVVAAGTAAAGALDQRVGQQAQGTIIPTTAFSTAGTGTPATNVFPVILSSLLPVVDGNGQAKLPMERLKTSTGNNGATTAPSNSSSSHMSSKKKKRGVVADHSNPLSTTNRRSSHNAIERRYRSSINDKILELKSLVITTADPNEKVHKAAILRSSIETIKFLQNANSRLEKENKMLRSKKCGVCGAEQQFEAPTTNENLRDLLINSPPMSESGSSSPSSDGGRSGGSSPDRSPESSHEKRIQGGNGTSAAPLVLFAVACGLFLINPGTNDTSPHHHHHVTKREVVEGTYVSQFQEYVPRITAMVLNLIVFMFLYKILGLFTSPETSDVCEPADSLAQSPPTSLKRMRLFKEFVSTMLSKHSPNHSLADAYICASKTANDPLTRRWIGLKIIQNSMSPDLQDTLISGLMLVNSSIMVKSTLSRMKALIEKDKKMKLHPLFEIGLHHIGSSSKYMYPNAFTSEIPNGLLGPVMQCVKNECLTKGITRLLLNGDRNTSTWFKNCLRVILSEVKGRTRDHVAEWWACVFWVEAEWLLTRGSGNKVHLEKLFRVIDSIWKNQLQREKRSVEQPLYKAVYHIHRVRREIITATDDRNLTTSQLHKLINSAGEALRESINLTEKEHTLQLVWTLVAEWVLETRIELWEECGLADPEFCCQFSSDLDTLRSLCHHVPTSLPSVYLHEAALRLMSRASPGRTQQLLDASLRPPRLSNKHPLLCVNSSSNSSENPSEITQSDIQESTDSNSSCKSRVRGGSNMVREKRKALAMYLRCKHLPVHVITCPGEKAGMLRETIKLLEKFGDQRKINQCVEMIKGVV